MVMWKLLKGHDNDTAYELESHAVLMSKLLHADACCNRCIAIPHLHCLNCLLPSHGSWLLPIYPFHPPQNWTAWILWSLLVRIERRVARYLSLVMKMKMLIVQVICNQSKIAIQKRRVSNHNLINRSLLASTVRQLGIPVYNIYLGKNVPSHYCVDGCLVSWPRYHIMLYTPHVSRCTPVLVPLLITNCRVSVMIAEASGA